MRISARGAFILAGLTAILLAAGAVVREGETVAQSPVTLAVDTDPTGNTATSVGSIEDCLSVDTGDTLEVDIIIQNVENLLGWEVFFAYDKAIINVIGADVGLFQAVNPSSVLNASEAVPDKDGVYLAAAADSRSVDSGSGVLARLTLQTLDTGISKAELPILGPGVGPTLTTRTFDVIDHPGDIDGDQVFDGDIPDAKIAVGVPCPIATPTPTPTPTSTPGPGSDTPTPTPTPAVLDVDADRVSDGDDQCPDTPSSASVDTSGCSETQLEQLTEQAQEQLLESLTAGLNLAVSLDTVTVGGSTVVLAVFADENDEPVSGVDIAFGIEEQPGSDANLDGEVEVTKTSDDEGVAKATLNVGSTPGEIVVSATAEGQTETVMVTVAAVGSAAAGPATGADQTPGPGTPVADGTPGAGSAPVAGTADDGSSDGDGGSGLPAWMVVVIVVAALALATGVFAAQRAVRGRSF